MRPTWDEYYLSMTNLVSSRSPCHSIKVGAIITLNNRVISTGYNGPPKKVGHCKKCTKVNHCYKAIHAEVNAIIQSGEVKNGILYCTHSPCIECAKIILNAGIIKVRYIQLYHDNREDSIKYLYKYGVDI